MGQCPLWAVRRHTGVLCRVWEHKSRRHARDQSWATLDSKALAAFVFWSRSRAATKFSRSMAVTTPNTICLLLDLPGLWSEEGIEAGG